MKKFMFLLASFILTGLTINAANTNTENNTTIYNKGYGNSFIFVEDGIEFSVFPDGQFDFNILRGNSNFNVSIGSPNVNISFNSGYDYNAYVQYDEFGAIIQIENTPIFYDYYGRISQVGNININYNNRGFVNRLGGLYIHYNNYNVFSHYTGFINIYNRNYVYRPWHRFYSVPAYDYCVVYNRPYRQHYTPIRYTYVRPFYNNYRPKTAIYSRRGETIVRNRDYATVNRSSRNVTEVNRYSDSRRYDNNSNRNSQVAKRNDDRYENSNNNDSRRYDNNSSRNYQVEKKNDNSNNNRISRDNYQVNNTKRTPENVNRTVTQNNSRTNDIKRTRENTVNQKPNNNNDRTYTRSEVNTRNTPQATQRSNQSKPVAAQTRSNSGNNNTRLEAPQRRRS